MKLADREVPPPHPIPRFIGMPLALASAFGEARSRRKEDDRAQIRTGFQKFDQAMGSLRRGELIVVAGRPAMAKTAFALHMAHVVTDEWAIGRKRRQSALPATLLYSTQLSPFQIAARLLCARVGLSRRALQHGRVEERSEWRCVRHQAELLADGNLHLRSEPEFDIGEIYADVASASSARPVRLAIIDGLQQIGNIPFDTDSAAAARHVVTALKTLATEQDIVILAVLDLPPPPNSRENLRPTVWDLGIWQPLETIADKLLFFHRDIVADPMSKNPLDLQIDAAVVRDGRPFRLTLKYLAEYGRIMERSVQVEEPKRDGPDWHVAYRWLPPEQGKRLGALVLHSELELERESEAMHNCAAEHAPECRDGLQRIVSIRETECGEPVADALLQYGMGRDGWWHVRELVDREHNDIESGEAFEAAQRAAKEYTWHAERMDLFDPPRKREQGISAP